MDDPRIADPWWRLNNLYYITNKSGKKIKFKPNWAQKAFYTSMWYLSIILKARQLGFTTFIQIFILDRCLFNKNVRAGVIAHNKDDAQVFFRDKIKFAYESLPDWLRQAIPATKCDAGEIMLANNSSIRVGTSMRSGTLQYLHVSEFGKIAAKYPDKAREIMTGAFEAVEAGQFIFVESTAEGSTGLFADMVGKARKLIEMGSKLTMLDFKFLFYPWWKNPANTLDPDGVVIISRMVDYFAGLEQKEGILLTSGQKAWYVKKEDSLGDDIKREHPSTADEAFEATISGAYFSKQMTKAREQGRVCRVPHTEGINVDLWFDIGFNDETGIWFTQDIGREIRVLRYYENSGEGLEFYKKTLDEMKEEHGYHYGRIVWPHDGGHHEWGTGKKRSDMAAEMGMIVEIVPRGTDKQLSIQAARTIIQHCVFDEVECADGLDNLDSYRKQWDSSHAVWKKDPLHSPASNCADAFQTFGMAHKFNYYTNVPLPKPKPLAKKSAKGWT